MEKDFKLRTTFEEVAELYARIRPGYPDELFEDLINATRLAEDSKLLEIAPGTGQATLSLAKRGFHITAVELGPRLATIAKRNLRDYPAVQVITGAFEDIDLSSDSYDLVYVATAFHWIRPDVRFSKPYRVLKPDGYLAIIGGNHVCDTEEEDLFFEATQPLYNKFMPEPPGTPPFRPRRSSEVAPAELDEELFQLVHFKCFPRTISYTAEEYVQLLNTESEKLALPADRRKAFLEEMRRLVSDTFGGVVKRRYANALTVAGKMS